jgi:hypothetical protein
VLKVSTFRDRKDDSTLLIKVRRITGLLSGGLMKKASPDEPPVRASVSTNPITGWFYPALGRARASNEVDLTGGCVRRPKQEG